ncbi:MAG: SRPBCC domain-containing protein [Sandaracinaceae bacterium]
MSAPEHDHVRVQALVRVPPAEAFRLFTEDIDRWWRHGRAYRAGPTGGSVVHLEPRVGGALYEAFETESGGHVERTGTVLAWEPPERLLLEWRHGNFAPAERTEVEVRFAPSPSGTQVTLVHRGWSAIRPDHPVRHGDAPRAFLRSHGLWWGRLLRALQETALQARER